MNFTYEFVKQARDDYSSKSIEVVPEYEFSQYETLRTIEGSAPRPVAPPGHQGSNEARTLLVGGCAPRVEEAFALMLPFLDEKSRAPFPSALLF